MCEVSFDPFDGSDQWIWTEQKVLLRINQYKQLAVMCWRPQSHRRRTFEAHQREEAFALLRELGVTELEKINSK